MFGLMHGTHVTVMTHVIAQVAGAMTHAATLVIEVIHDLILVVVMTRVVAHKLAVIRTMILVVQKLMHDVAHHA